MQYPTKMELIEIERLTVAGQSARKHDTEQLALLCESIETYGFIQPLLINGELEIIDGCARLAAAQRLELERVPCVFIEHLTPTEIRAFALVGNRLAELAHWDKPELIAELHALAIEGIDIERLGFDLEALGMVQAEDDGYCEPAPPRTARGELYQLGAHRLLVGDATDAADMDRLMGGDKANLLLTDPPYNVDYESDDGKSIANDHMDSSDFEVFLGQSFSVADAHMAPGAAFYIWHADTNGLQLRATVARTGWQLRQCLIWCKNMFVFGRQDYHWQHEPCLYGWKSGAAHYFTPARTQSTVLDEHPDLRKLRKEELRQLVEDMLEAQAATTVIREDRPQRSFEHPTMKPVPLMGRLITNSSRRGEIVLDPFGGSGSTLIACEELSRACRTMELDPQYADVIIARWEQLTNNQAKQIN